jgi:hypothetical protein
MKLIFLFTGIFCYFYDFPLELWNETIRHVGPGNHPDVYHFALGLGACSSQPELLGMFSNASMTYGTRYKQICLVLESGVILGYERMTSPNMEIKFEIKPSDSNQFEYLKGLDFLRTVTKLLRQGHDYHPRPEVPRPKVQTTLNYCAAASRKQLERVGGVVGLWFPKEVEYHSEQRLYLEYQVKKDADILLQQFDRLQFYSEQRFDAYGDLWNSTSLVFKTPSHVQDTDSFRIKVAIVPKGESIQEAFYVVDGTTAFLKKDRVQYLFCTYRPTLGSIMKCYYNTRVSIEREVRLFLESNGIVYAETKRTSNDANPWEVFVNSSWPTGSYRAVAQLVDTMDLLDEKEESVTVVASE